MSKDEDAAARRERMVREQITARGIRDPGVLDAMRRVPREAFVSAALRDRACNDGPLPIGEGQTISQPYIVALMLEAAMLQPDDRVLDVGAGSGYAAAAASLLAGRVDAIERIATLCAEARTRLADLGYARVVVHCGDGSAGWPQGAPFDAILVAAAGPRVPAVLRQQLAIGGRLVMPVGHNPVEQRLVKITRRTESDFDEESLCGVAFVPLIGAHAWAAPR